MGIILKFLLRSIWEKKLRTFLILFSIMLSGALFFASLAVTDSVSALFIDEAKQFFGSADIIIYPGNDSPRPFLPVRGADEFRPKTEYMIEALQTSAYLAPERNKTVSVSLRGIATEDMDISCPFYTVDGSTVTGFTGKKVVISKDAAETFDRTQGQIRF